jgi:hypothetical protein
MPAWGAGHLICATRGEVGEMDQQYLLGFDSVAARLKQNFAARRKLGLSEILF